MLSSYLSQMDRLKLKEAIDKQKQFLNKNITAEKVMNSYLSFLENLSVVAVESYFKNNFEIAMSAIKSGQSVTQFDILAKDAIEICFATEQGKNTSLTNGRIAIESGKISDEFLENTERLPNIEDEYYKD